MNLSTRRLSEKQFQDWIKIDSNYMWTVRAKDKFGDYGIIGILSLSAKNKNAYVVDFILSCRIVGRCIEETMIKFLKEFCKKNKIEKINGKYIKTEKNALCYQFLKKLKIIDNDGHNLTFLSNQDEFNLPNIKVIKPSFKGKVDAQKDILA